MIKFVDLKRQYLSIKEEIDTAIADCLDNASFISGARVKKLEEDFSSISGAKFGIAASSGTTALHLALEALGVKEGDEVITVANTFIATTEAIAQTKATIRLVDIDAKTYNIDVSKIEAAITDKTKVLMPVHLYGQPCDIDAIMNLAKKYNLKVIFDAAQGHMSEYKGQPIGKFGDIVCFSFYPGKNLGAYGDAGMVITNNEELANKMRKLANHGRIDKYRHDMNGYNYRMDEIQAAILNVKLKHLPEWTKNRQKNAAKYNELLKDSGIVTPFEADNADHVYHLYIVRVSNRDELREKLSEAGIESGIHYPIPIHFQDVYANLGYKKGDFPLTEEYSEQILSLPMFAELEDEEIEKIVDVLKQEAKTGCSMLDARC
ncbi:MAG: DegT/DnrJ/EryC1/StrS family aminotransferase [Candidatus Zapsychrus exili]|nr:DegT/DnrJ/EryC1/StrS family aminotransferase [Candidatus Zapsychrus exili]